MVGKRIPKTFVLTTVVCSLALAFNARGQECAQQPPGTACGDPRNDVCTDPDTCDADVFSCPKRVSQR